jgi:hypothetical protein
VLFVNAESDEEAQRIARTYGVQPGVIGWDVSGRTRDVVGHTAVLSAGLGPAAARLIGLIPVERLRQAVKEELNRGSKKYWATESLVAAREAYLIPGTEKRLKSGEKLSREYYDAHLPAVRRRPCLAGFRLATIRNAPFAEQDADCLGRANVRDYL